MPIRPFRLGDIVLLQRLRRHATQLNIERTLLQPHSPFWAALHTCLPWDSHGYGTYVLRQEENGLARAGLIQFYIRPHCHEADVTLLAPALDAPEGHPAIWQKLLAQSAQHLVRRHINRLYSDLPDQPLVVHTFKQAGFSLFARETIWRLAATPLAGALPEAAPIRPQQPQDAWALQRLYYRITPTIVRQAEVWHEPEGEGFTPQPPLLANRHAGVPCTGYVLEGVHGLDGCVQILWGALGTWIRLWLDTNDPDTTNVHRLLRFALQTIMEAPRKSERTYIGVRDYQTGIAPVLSDYGFAPFTDRAWMVRNILQWAQEPVSSRLPALETVREAVPGSLAMPKVTAPDRSTSFPPVWAESQESGYGRAGLELLREL